MLVIVAVVVALVVLGAAFYFFQAGKKSDALPPPRAEADAQVEAKKAEPKAEKKDEPKKLDAKKPEAAKAEAPKPEAPKAKGEPAAEPKTEPRTPEPAKTEPVVETAAEAKPEVAEPPKPVEPVVEPKKPSMRPGAAKDAGESVQALKKGLATTRGGFIARLAQLFGRKKEIDPALLDEVQTVLLSADIGPRTAEKMLEGLREEVARGEHAGEDSCLGEPSPSCDGDPRPPRAARFVSLRQAHGHRGGRRQRRGKDDHDRQAREPLPGRRQEGRARRRRHVPRGRGPPARGVGQARRLQRS